MDVINYVRDIVGFIFMIDEWGGVDLAHAEPLRRSSM